MSYKSRKYLAQQRAQSKRQQQRVTRLRSATTSLVVEGAMFALMGALFGYALWSVLWN